MNTSQATGASALPYAGDLGPAESWTRLKADPTGQLIDVRTVAEWTFVGVPDLGALGREAIFCEWQRFPSASNPAFVEEVAEALNGTGWRQSAPLFFLCRSGGRSRSAAIAMTSAGFGPCFNVADGFEGAPDANRHRGSTGGWKAEGLPWIQS